jgi:hypothetical protein
MQASDRSIRHPYSRVASDPASAVVSAVAFSGAKLNFAERHRLTHVGQSNSQYAGMTNMGENPQVPLLFF